MVRGEFVTRVYFVRHAETDISVKEDAIRPLSAKGMRESLLVTEFLQDKSIDVILSSPYKRTLDTLVDFSNKSGIGIDTNESALWVFGLRILTNLRVGSGRIFPIN